MQELEKILEEISQEKLKHWDSSKRLDTDKLIGWCFDRCIDIIRKHMNDGWIPVEEQLPEEGQEVWISVKTDCVRRGMYTKCFGFGMREGFICSDGFVDINAVNAWKLYIMPEPYCPKAKVPERKQEWKERMLRNFMKKGER